MRPAEVEVVMATRTVVCPECGSAAAPGRYACAECGALLAAVGLQPRSLETLLADAPVDASLLDDYGDLPLAGDPERDPEAEPEPEPAPVAEPEWPADRAAQPVATTAAVMADRPLPSILRDFGSEPEDSLEPDTWSEPAMAAPSPTWPPPGDHGTTDLPAPRTPAGAYLPPSAVLPPLDAPASAASPGKTDADSARDTTSVGDRAAAALSGAFSSVRIGIESARRAVLVGAALVSLGFLLPWVNTIPGSSVFANYLDRWGLAGPGSWLVLLAAIGLVLVAGSAGRPSTWPIGLTATALAAFVVGLVWPYVMSAHGGAIGIWVALIGAMVLVIGGLLERRARHASAEASV